MLFINFLQNFIIIRNYGHIENLALTFIHKVHYFVFVFDGHVRANHATCSI